MLGGVYLMLMIGPKVPIPAPSTVIEALTSAQVTVSAAERSGFQLQFSIDTGSLLNTVLLPAGYFDPGQRVILTVTVGATAEVLMDGIVTQQELSPGNTPGQSTLSVTGEDITLLMDVDESIPMVFPGLTYSARVAAILAKYSLYGVAPLVTPEIFVTVPNPTEKIPSQTGSDYAYIKQLADEVGYVFYVDPGPVPGVSKAYWGPDIMTGLPQSALNVNMDAATNVESISFSHDGLKDSKQIAYYRLEETHVSLPLPVPDISMLLPSLTVKGPAKLKSTVLKNIDNLSLTEAISKSLGKQKKDSVAVTASGSLDVLRYGKILKSRRLVGVRGAGLTHDGLYYVNSVTHDIKPGEYKQQFSLSRSGLVSLTPAVVP